MNSTYFNTVQSEIAQLEERLRVAELGPDPQFFTNVLDDNFIVVLEDGHPFLGKSKVVEAHQPGNKPKFTRVEMSDMAIIDHGSAAVVTCKGTYENVNGSFTLKFLRVWLKKNGEWRIIAGAVSK